VATHSETNDAVNDTAAPATTNQRKRKYSKSTTALYYDPNNSLASARRWLVAVFIKAVSMAHHKTKADIARAMGVGVTSFANYFGADFREPPAFEHFVNNAHRMITALPITFQNLEAAIQKTIDDDGMPEALTPAFVICTEIRAVIPQGLRTQAQDIPLTWLTEQYTRAAVIDYFHADPVLPTQHEDAQ